MANYRWRPVSFLFLLACTAWINTAWADQITLKNGDRVTGAIVKKDGNNLTVKSALMGTVTLPWDQITEIKTDESLNVVLAGQTVQPPVVIKTPINATNGQITLSAAPAGQQTVAPAAVAAVRDTTEEAAYERMLHPTLLQLWTGTGTLGLAGTAGNAVTSTFNVAVNAARATSHDNTAVYFNTVKSSATVSGKSADTAQAIRGGWKYNRKVGSRLDIDSFNDYEYDRFQNLDLRFVLGGGLGFRAWKARRGALALQAGVDYDRDKFAATSATAAFTRTSSEGYWGDDFNYKVSGATSIVQTFRMFSNLSDTGQYRANFDLSANTKIRKWLVWNLSAGDRYLSDPVPGLKRNDVLYTTGIGLTFGH